MGEYVSAEIMIFTYETKQPYIPVQRAVSIEICLILAGIKLDK